MCGPRFPSILDQIVYRKNGKWMGDKAVMFNEWLVGDST